MKRAQGNDIGIGVIVMPVLPREVWHLIVDWCCAHYRPTTTTSKATTTATTVALSDVPIISSTQLTLLHHVFKMACLSKHAYQLVSDYVRTHWAPLRGTDSRVMLYFRDIEALILRSSTSGDHNNYARKISRRALVEMTQLTSLVMDPGADHIDDATLGALTRLRHLRLEYTQRYITDTCIGALCHLHTLELPYNIYITAGAFTTRLNGLTKLDLTASTAARHITDQALSALTRLTDLNLSYAQGITDDGLTHLKHLRRLNLAGNTGIGGLCLSHLDSLTQLNLDDNISVLDSCVTQSGVLTRLQRLWIRDFLYMGDRTDSAMPALRELAINIVAPADSLFQWLTTLPLLDTLVVSFCHGDIAATLGIDGNSSATISLRGLTALRRLVFTTSSMSAFHHLINDRTLEAMTALEQLAYCSETGKYTIKGGARIDIGSCITLERWIGHSRLRLVDLSLHGGIDACGDYVNEMWLA